MRRAVIQYRHLWISSLLLTFALGGCGSGQRANLTSVTSPGSGNSRAVLTIHWPSHATRMLPSETNRVVVYVAAPDLPGGEAFIQDRPPAGGTTSVNVSLLAGAKRAFSVQARKVDQTRYATVQQVPYTSRELSQGTLLATGADQQARDISSGQTVSISITLAGPATPPGGTTAVNVTVNQVLTGTFPRVLVLQLIRDQDGNPISGLTPSNFDVTEDGQPAIVTDVRTVQQAASNMSVALVLDRSGSMAGTPNSDLEGAATEFVSLLTSGDDAEVINFDTNVEVTQAFTRSQSDLTAAIQGQFSRFGGGTALYDAMAQGITDTAARGGREAIITITDGGNNASGSTEQDIIQQARAAGIPIFCVGLAGSDLDEQPLEDISSQTGGLYFLAPGSAELNNIYRSISNQLNGQIQLSFTSPSPAATGAVRHVVVTFHYGSFSGQSTYDYTL